MSEKMMSSPKYLQARGMDLSVEEVNQMATLFKALSHVTRLQILSILTREKDVPVSSIADELEMSVSRVSHHLSLLENLGFVGARQEGKQVIHYISDDCIIDIMRRSREHVTEG